jgi:U5 snRNP spliceosome subunit
MRTRNRLLVAFGATVMAASAALAVMGPASAANLLVNPGFETGTMSGWSCSNGSIVSSPVHTGSRALKGAVTSSDHAKCTQTVTVQPNTTYTLSAWVRGNYVYLGVTGGPSTWTPSAASYTQLRTSFTTGANQTSAQVYLHGWYAQGDYYADDVSLDGPGGGTPSPTPTPTTSPTSSPPPPPPPAGGAMAAPYLYMGWGNPPSPGTVMSATGIKQFTMAFMLSGGGCTPAWDSNRPLKGGVDEQAINAIRANGGDIEISFGGWSGNKLGPNCSSASALAGRTSR